MSSASTAETRAGWWLLVPPAAWLSLFFILPLLIVALISLLARGVPVSWELDGGSYLRLIDPLYFGVFLRSLTLAAGTTVLCLLIGYPLAYYIARRPPALRRWLHLMVLVPLWANSLVLVYAWIVLLRPNGLVEQLARWLGLVGEGGFSVLYSPAAVLIGLVYWYLPFMIYPLYSSIEKLDFSLLDAARDLGASSVQSFVRVTLPLTLPGVAVGGILVFVETLGAFVVPDLLGGAKSMMLGNLVQQAFLSIPQDWPLGAAAAITIAGFVALGLLLLGGVNRERTP